MNTLERVKNAIKAQIKEELSAHPLMDVETVKTDLLDWLAELKLPSGCKAASWAELIHVFPAGPEDVERTAGVRVRLALRLDTRDNKYIISIMECLNRDSRRVYLISVHVNWNVSERQVQKLIDEKYRGHFDDVLRARHSLWAQTFRAGELGDALDSCIKAILSNELVAALPQNPEVEPLKHPQTLPPRFPIADET
jgi:hypothetical protein